MGKYHKQESQYIYRQKEKVWHLFYSIIHKQQTPPLPTDRTTVALPFLDSPHLAPGPQ